MRQVLQDGFVVTLGPQGILPRATLVVEDGVIVAVEPDAPRRSGPDVVDCSRRLLLPALFNSHLHSEYALMKGLLEERRLDDWEAAPHYETAWQILEKTPRLDLLEAAYRASYLEQALLGVGFVAEFNCADDSACLSSRILKEVGLRGAATLKEGEALPSCESIVPVGFIHHEGQLTHAELAEVAALHRDRPTARFTLHAAETRERVAAIQARLGARTMALLDRHGLLSPRVLLSHAVHVNPEEIALMGARRVNVVASPVAEMKLSDGVSPVPAFLDAGIGVLLGTDCATCNNGGDLFQEMKVLGLLHKLTSGAQALPAELILETTTRAPARFWGEGDRLGSIEVGKQADIALLDRSAPALLPLIHRPGLSNVAANLVYGATGRDVTDLVIGGEFVVRDRRHRSLDADAVFRALQAATDALWDAAGC